MPIALHRQGGESGPGSVVVAGDAYGAHNQLGGAFHVLKAGFLEEVRLEQYPQHGPDVAIGLVVGVHQGLYRLRVPGRRDVPGRHLGFVGDEEVVQVPRQEAGGCRLIGQDFDDIFAVEVPGVPQEGLFAVVVVFGLVLEVPVETAQGVSGNLGGDGPPGKGPRRLFNIVLGIVAHAQGEQLHQLTAPVLVDGAVMVAVVVQPVDHRRVLGQLHQQFLEAAQAVLAEHLDLLGQLGRIVHFGVARGEQLVPEQGYLFFQGPLGVNHPVHPISLVDGRSQSALVAGEIPVKFVFVDRG